MCYQIWWNNDLYFAATEPEELYQDTAATHHVVEEELYQDAAATHHEPEEELYQDTATTQHVVEEELYQDTGVTGGNSESSGVCARALYDYQAC